MTLAASIAAGFQSVAADIKQLNGLVMTPAERAVLDDLSGAIDSVEQRADAAIASAAAAASSAEAANQTLADAIAATNAATDAVSAVTTSLANKQDSLVDGANIKTISGYGLAGAGNVALTKADVGLDNVDNTNDVDKPVSNATQAALDTKVDKVVGKQLSSEDYTSADKAKLDGVEDGANAYTHPDNHPASVITQDANNRFVTDAEKAAWNAKQALLVSGTNLKTINGESLLGKGDVVVTGGGSGGPTLQGDTSPYLAQTTTYQITNYNSFSSYVVSASAGTASINGDTITYIAPATAGSVDLTLMVDDQPAVFAITVQAAGVTTPTNTIPADGATGITDSPTLQSSAFATYGQVDTHLASRWTLYQDGVEVYSSGWLTDALTSYTIPVGVVSAAQAYTWTVEYRGSSLGDSPASGATGFTTVLTFNNYIPTPAPTPANFGDPFEGGFYMGLFWNQIAQSTSSKTLATGAQTFTVPDMTTVPIVYSGQTLEVRSRANPANKFMGTVTGASGTTLTLNVTSIGGSGTFSDWSVMSRFRHIVAPKSSGEHTGIALKNVNTALPVACQTLTEGWEATLAMVAAGDATMYPAAHWARNLTIGGKNDWHIPARDVLELSWRNGKPTTDANYVTANRPVASTFNYTNNGSYGDTANTHGLNNNSAPAGAAYTAALPAQTAAAAFRTGGAEAFEYGSVYYWSSSDYNDTSAWSQYWRSSGPGRQGSDGKASTSHVRAARRSII